MALPGLTAALALLLSQAASDGLPAILPEPHDELVDTLEAKTDKEQRMTVPVDIGEQGPFRFLIDTGSQRTVVSTTLASQLALELGPVSRIVTVGGVNTVPTAHLDQFRLGQQTYHRTHVPLLEEQHMGADGIIGTDTLQGQRVLIDFTQDTIRIGNKKKLGGNNGYEIIVTARRRSGQLVMTQANLDGIPVTVIVDTGAGISVGNRALQKALASRDKASETVELTDATGNTLVADLGLARQLDIENLRIVDVVVAFADTPAFTALDLGERPALFLGMRELRLFKRVAIDFRKRQVMFDMRHM